MASLSGNKIKDTYQSLIKLTDNGNLTTGAKQLTDGFGNNSPLYISTTQIGIGVTPEATYDLHVYQNAKVGGNLTITGDLTVNGTTTTVDTDTLRVEDPLIEVARNNTSSDAVDIGIYGKYAPSGTTLYAGLFRDTGDDKFKLFKSLEEQPTTTVNTSGTGYAVATLVANVEGTLTGVIASTTTATTQSANDNSTKVATTAYVDSSAGNYLPLAGGTMSGNIAMGSNNISGGGTFTATTFSGQLDGTISSATTATTQSQGDNSTKVATTAYVDSIVTAQDLDFAGDSGTGAVDLDSQTFTIAGTSNEIETSASGQTLTIGLPNDVTIGNNLTVTNNLSVTGTIIADSYIQTNSNFLTKGTLKFRNNADSSWINGFRRVSGVDTLELINISHINTNGGGAVTIGNDLIVDNELTVSGTGQSSFAGQVTIPATPSASTDAASKGYVDSQVGANNELSEVLANGNTTGGTDIAVSANDDITFTDSSKAIFGDDSDLEIYHDGSKSVIADVGTGALRIAGTNFELRNADQSKFYMNASDGGAINLYYNNSKKLETTNTGINVTGGITGDDSVFIEGNTNPNFTAHDITNETYTSLWSGDTEAALTFNHSLFRITSSAYNFTGTDLVTITSGGNVTIGTSTTTPSVHYDNLVIEDVAGNNVGISLISGTGNNTALYFGDSADTDVGQLKYSHATNDMFFVVNASTAMTIDSSGQVGIGTTSPLGSSNLHVSSANGTAYTSNAQLRVSGGATSNNRATILFSDDALSDGKLSYYPASGTSAYFSLSARGTEADFIVKADGKVGTGTTSPAAKLEAVYAGGYNEGIKVRSTSGFAVLTMEASSNSYPILEFREAGTQKWQIFNEPNDDSLNLYAFGSGASTKMNIQQGGNVGIGATSFASDHKLQIHNASGTYARFALTNSATGTGSSDGLRFQMENLNSIIKNQENGYLTFGTNGRETDLRIDSSGNVGIGTTSPNLSSSGTALTVNSSSGANAAVEISDGGTLAGLLWGRSGTGVNVWSIPSIPLIFGTANTERMRIDSSGNLQVGDGTISAAGMIHAYKSSALADLVLQSAGGSGRAWRFVSDTDGKFYIRDNNAASNRLYIDTSGNVGINDTSPLATLSVISNNSTYPTQTVINAAGGGDGFVFQRWQYVSGNTNYRCDLKQKVTSGVVRYAFDLVNNGVAYDNNLVLDRGNVGIGTASPSDLLHLKKSSGDAALRIETVTGGDPTIIFNSAAANRSGIIKYQDNGTNMGRIEYVHNGDRIAFQAGSATGETMSIKNGAVGIGTTSPTYTFHVKSSNNVSIFEDSSGSSGATFCLFNAPSVFAMGSITRNGTANSVLFNTGSDYRLKEDLQDFNALDLVDNITAYDYKWKDTEQRDYGFVAHELQEVMPNVVSGEKDGEMMQGVDYSKLTPVLLKAIQELKAEIETLKAQINN